MTKIETLAVHVGREIEAGTGAVTPSITLATTFERPADGSLPDDAFIYTRSGNPNRNNLERAIAMLEGGEVGLAFAEYVENNVLGLAAPGDPLGVKGLLEALTTRLGIVLDVLLCKVNGVIREAFATAIVVVDHRDVRQAGGRCGCQFA